MQTTEQKLTPQNWKLSILELFPLALSGDLYIHLNFNFLHYQKLLSGYVEVRESHRSIIIHRLVISLYC